MRLRVVTGPPCSGKSTLVDEQRQPGDVVIDFDRLAVALGLDGEHADWDDPASVHRYLARVARASVLKVVLATRVDDGPGTVWVIDTAPQGWQLDSYLRARAVIDALDPGAAECHRRAAADHRPAATHEQIDAWYAQHGQPPAAEEYFA